MNMMTAWASGKLGDVLLFFLCGGSAMAMMHGSAGALALVAFFWVVFLSARIIRGAILGRVLQYACKDNVTLPALLSQARHYDHLARDRFFSLAYQGASFYNWLGWLGIVFAIVVMAGLHGMLVMREFGLVLVIAFLSYGVLYSYIYHAGRLKFIRRGGMFGLGGMMVVGLLPYIWGSAQASIETGSVVEMTAQAANILQNPAGMILMVKAIAMLILLPLAVYFRRVAVIYRDPQALWAVGASLLTGVVLAIVPGIEQTMLAFFIGGGVLLSYRLEMMRRRQPILRI